jgi:hypothetical protein
MGETVEQEHEHGIAATSPRLQRKHPFVTMSPVRATYRA